MVCQGRIVRPTGALCFFPQSPQISSGEHRQVRTTNRLSFAWKSLLRRRRCVYSLRYDLSVLRIKQGSILRSQWSLQGSSAQFLKGKMWRRLILDRGCFNEGVVVKCSAIYAESRPTEKVDRCTLLCTNAEDADEW